MDVHIFLHERDLDFVYKLTLDGGTAGVYVYLLWMYTMYVCACREDVYITLVSSLLPARRYHLLQIFYVSESVYKVCVCEDAGAINNLSIFCTIKNPTLLCEWTCLSKLSFWNVWLGLVYDEILLFL